ncbi:MAG: hypothetical protein JXQ73_02380 [Phycisphaerae bacterium]|nr:hypothetical protein [Phycisphaerae bacterium]
MAACLPRCPHSMLLALLALLPLSLTDRAWAHRPTFSDGSANEPNKALVIDDVTVSQVVYHQATAESPRLWQKFDGKKDQPLWVQIGVPVIDRLKDYRPAVALLGPGLAPVELPFSIPDNLGGVIITTDDVTDPRVFHEHFTDTKSWIIKEQEIPLPADGTYYLVGYLPSDELGKFWVAVGKREVFGLADLFKFREWTVKARQFHEQDVGLGLPTIPCGIAAAPVMLAIVLLARGLLLVPVSRCRR